MLAALLPFLLVLARCGEAANEREVNVGDFLFGDQKVHLYSIQGELASSNWSYFELKWEGRVRIILDSLSGDADLYLSYDKKHPGVGVNEHDMLSMTCGLDVLDVPQFSSRPVHLGVYGHPSKSQSTYNLLLVMIDKAEGVFEQDVQIPAELIYSVETDTETTSYPSSVKDTLYTLTHFFVELLIELVL